MKTEKLLLTQFHRTHYCPTHLLLFPTVFIIPTQDINIVCPVKVQKVLTCNVIPLGLTQSRNGGSNVIIRTGRFLWSFLADVQSIAVMPCSLLGIFLVGSLLVLSLQLKQDLYSRAHSLNTEKICWLIIWWANHKQLRFFEVHGNYNYVCMHYTVLVSAYLSVAYPHNNFMQ